MTFYDDDPYDPPCGDGEWREGQCDQCSGVTDAPGPLTPVCACAIGQGAPGGACRCGPPPAA